MNPQVRTLKEQRTRTLNERFATAAGQLGDDKPPAVRLAGMYAMAGLADDWEENRQTCVDVLCGYLRMPYEPDPGQDAPERERLAFRGTVSFGLAEFSGSTVNFDLADFSGGTVDFTGPRDWRLPPAFPWTDTPPPGVKLPDEGAQFQA